MTEHISPATIMVVDDTPENLDLLREMLQNKGYRVQAFPRGSMAIKAAQIRPPDLILLDVMMPEMNGFEVSERLKADDTLRDIPVLFISALTDTADKVNAFAAGGVDYVTKPFQIEEVYARVKAHLELRRQRRELREAYNKLSELETLRNNLTHMVVHDMRSPLMVVDGSYEVIMMEKDRLSPRQQMFVTMGRNSCCELIEMVSSLLDVSRMEAGQMPLNRMSIDVLEIAGSAVGSVAVLAEAKALTVCVTGHPAVSAVDRDVLHRVFVNLLGNAIKFSPNGRIIKVDVESAGDRVRASVTDQGNGIPQEYHQRIFDKFGQVESRKEGLKHSSGLGLTFCKLAVEAHGGRIGVESEVGRGSTFWLTLPKGCTE